jgi:hypothetical protein
MESARVVRAAHASSSQKAETTKVGQEKQQNKTALKQAATVDK